MRAVPLAVLLALAACGPADAPGADLGDDPDVGGIAVDTTALAEPTSTVTVAYKGRLETGEVFDESERATFNLQQVIPGFQTGITGMRVGETKSLSVPPDEGYGDSPPPGIPPGATLNFEVTLLGIE